MRQVLLARPHWHQAVRDVGNGGKPLRFHSSAIVYGGLGTSVYLNINKHSA
jgi:hypothetical protein